MDHTTTERTEDASTQKDLKPRGILDVRPKPFCRVSIRNSHRKKSEEAADVEVADCNQFAEYCKFKDRPELIYKVM